jgi:glycosyltransferase involved in cell wall biosynthesis
MKVLFNTYPWAFDAPGGGERQLLAYKTHLIDHGITADLYNMWEPNLQKYRIFHSFAVMPGMIELSTYVKQKGLRLVVSPNLWISRETKEGCPYHEEYPSKDIWNMLYTADLVVVNSVTEGDRLSEVFSMPREKFSVVYNGVEEEFIHQVDPDLFKTSFRLQRPYILNVANIERRKNQLRFIEAMKRYPDFDLIIVGHVRDQAYADECMKLGGIQVKMVGPLPYNSNILRSGIAGCALFAMPSLLETPSISALEAAAADAKILITSIGSTREYFGDSVTYVDPLSVESMAEAIRNALVRTTEHSTWVVRANYMWKKCMPALVDCYRSLQA